MAKVHFSRKRCWIVSCGHKPCHSAVRRPAARLVPAAGRKAAQSALAACLLAAAALGAPAPRLADAPRPVVGDKVKERFTPAPLDRQKIQGWLGERMRVNLEGRLLHVNQAALLAGFQKRPGNQAWVGEHVGKFLNAAALTWAYTGDARLKAIMDRTAHSLIAVQLPDGYLGTYTDAQRWTGWDVWVHKYDLIGLLSYYEVTGDPQALQASRKIGDLLVSAFGDGPGQRDLIKAGAHVGMAATSVLGPICTLYRYTGEQRYLDFARYIVRADDQPDGPNIIRSLTQTGSVLMAGDAKARELLSNLAGLLDLYRLTGDETLLTPALAAWKDITAKRLYITGTASVNEFFKGDGDLPGEEGLNPGEGSVTETWIELNAQLLRITGEASYAEEIERTVFNGLLGAQDPRNGSVCPYLLLVGKKRTTTALIGSVSSLPCGIARLPQLIWGAREGGVAVALYAPGEATIPVRDGLDVTLRSETRFPADGAVSITVLLRHAARFPVFLRVPSWCTRFVATVKDAATFRPARSLPGARARLATGRCDQDRDGSAAAHRARRQELPGLRCVHSRTAGARARRHAEPGGLISAPRRAQIDQSRRGEFHGNEAAGGLVPSVYD